MIYKIYGTDIKEYLKSLTDNKYKVFHQKLVPTVNNLLGIRVPVLKKLARDIAKNDFREYLKYTDNEFYEETMLTGLVIGYIKVDFDERIEYIKNFVPQIDNWAVCDSFSANLTFIKNNMEKTYSFLKGYIGSEKEFEIRFLLVVLMDYYINDDYINEIFNVINSVKKEDYYVKMAIAWLLSVCFVKYEEKTLNYLKCSKLSDFIYNKTLQKIIESNRVDKEKKLWIKNMKR